MLTTTMLLAMTATDVHIGTVPLSLQLLVAVLQQGEQDAEIDAAAGASPEAPIQALQPLGDPFPTGIGVEWLGGLGDNLLVSVDLSTRFTWNTGSEAWSSAQFYGFDLYKVFSGTEGDIATMVLQGFASRIDGAAAPYFFDADKDWEFVYRIFNVNWRLDPRGGLNLKTGHFEMPFGLEALLDTNGTLRQVGTSRNLAIKTDWGATLNGVSNDLEYEVALGRGSGNGWHSDNDPYLCSWRVGTIFEADQWVGVSGFWGDLWRPGGAQVQRRRIGVDAGMHRGPWTLMGEVSGGANDGTSVVNGLVELDWHGPADEWLLYGQLQGWTERTAGWQQNIQAVLGCEWAMDRHVVLSFQYLQNLTMLNDASRTGQLQFQVRYRF